MNRAFLGALIAVAIAALTGVSYFLATSGLEGQIEKDVRERVQKSVELLVQNANLDMLKLQRRVELLARDKAFVSALGADEGPRPTEADEGFKRLAAKGKSEGEGVPDIFAIVDNGGKLVAQMGIANPVAGQWIESGKPKYRSISLALDKRQITSEIWEYQGRGLLKVGVAPVIDPDFDKVVGVLVMGYSLTATEAQTQEGLLGTDVAYFYGGRVYATSFRKGANEDTPKQKTLTDQLGSTKLDADAIEHVVAERVLEFEVDGEVYLATAGRLPRFSSLKLPADYESIQAGAIVLKSLTKAQSASGSVKLALLVLGAGALLLALLGMLLVAKTFLGPLDQIEVGINDIINGNLEHIFEPVGRDYEGMSNALNVMMARLLGRPEPGEEEYDEQGNVIMPSQLHFDTEGLSPKEAEAMALAQEPEADYYKRIFNEYLTARSQNGETNEGISFDSFVAKLHLNESTLRRKYECQAVRFAVLVKDGKVILKPVPIA